MRRSATSYQPVPSLVPRRAATVLAIPTLHHVEKGLSGLELAKGGPEDEQRCYEPANCCSDHEELAFASVKYSALPGSPGTEAEECNSSQTKELSPDKLSLASRDDSDSIQESTAPSVTEFKDDVADRDCADTFDTSATDSSSHEVVHKPLKDLIFKTNKELYDVDSNIVRYRVGLSKKVPSLHPNRRINGASSQ